MLDGATVSDLSVSPNIPEMSQVSRNTPLCRFIKCITPLLAYCLVGENCTKPNVYLRCLRCWITWVICHQSAISYKLQNWKRRGNQDQGLIFTLYQWIFVFPALLLLETWLISGILGLTDRSLTVDEAY